MRHAPCKLWTPPRQSCKEFKLPNAFKSPSYPDPQTTVREVWHIRTKMHHSAQIWNATCTMQNLNSHTKLVRRLSHLAPSKVTPAARTKLRENLSTNAPILYINPSYLNHDTSHTIWNSHNENSHNLAHHKGGKMIKKQPQHWNGMEMEMEMNRFVSYAPSDLIVMHDTRNMLDATSAATEATSGKTVLMDMIVRLLLHRNAWLLGPRHHKHHHRKGKRNPHSRPWNHLVALQRSWGVEKFRFWPHAFCCDNGGDDDACFSQSSWAKLIRLRCLAVSPDNRVGPLTDRTQISIPSVTCERDVGKESVGYDQLILW